MQKPLVSIICTAYNHEKYIRQTLESFVLQKTTFPIEVLIHDDASTDETANIIREYEKKYDFIRAIYQTENQYSKGVKITPMLIGMAQGEYIAICEGDDYFTDNQKIQKQVECLKNNSKCSAVIHSAEKVDENGKKIGYRKPYITSCFLSTKDIVKCIARNYALNSLLFRKEAFEGIEKIYGKAPVGDVAIALHLSLKGNFIYLNESMSAYRVGTKGSWTMRMKEDKRKHCEKKKKMVEFLNYFDELTEHSYSKEIDERKSYYYVEICVINGEIKNLWNKLAEPYMNSLPVNKKMMIIIKTIYKRINSR